MHVALPSQPFPMSEIENDGNQLIEDVCPDMVNSRKGRKSPIQSRKSWMPWRCMKNLTATYHTQQKLWAFRVTTVLVL